MNFWNFTSDGRHKFDEVMTMKNDSIQGQISFLSIISLITMLGIYCITSIHRVGMS